MTCNNEDTEALLRDLPRLRAAGDAQALSRAHARIVTAYLPLARKLARSTATTLAYDDRLQEAVLGLYSALAAYRPERGAFGPYARFWIRGAILAATKKAATAAPTDSLDERTYEDGSTLHEVTAADTSDELDHEDRIALMAAISQLDRADRRTVLAGLSSGTTVPPALIRKLRRLMHG